MRDVVSRYFELSSEIERAKADRDFAAAARAARATYALLPAVVRQWTREYGRWDIVTSHAVHMAPTLMAVIEDDAGIAELRRALERVPELNDWLPAADQAQEDLALVRRVMPLVEVDPGIIQSTLKARLGLAEGGRVSQLVAWLEKGRRLMRVKKGASYQLFPAGYAIPVDGVPAGAARPASRAADESSFGAAGPRYGFGAHTAGASTMPATAALVPRIRGGRTAKKARPLDFSHLPVVRLPLAPPVWEERAAREAASGPTDAPATSQKAAAGKSAEPKFTVESAGWRLAREVKLPAEERPDPAFRDAFHTRRYTHWLDPKGKREGFEYASAVLRVTDRAGRVTAEGGLAHDVYRSNVNVDGTGILFLSREGVLHGYTGDLIAFVEERLEELPEYRAQAERLGIEPRELKNHVRAVALSADRRRYLVTVVDEAWSVDASTGDVLWGLRMPTKDGWTRCVAERSGRAGTSAEVEAALRLMELSLPVAPADITRQYRSLAMRWHPDRNPGDPSATVRFQELRAATELLTGADLSQLSGREIERVTYEQVLSTTRVGHDVPDGRGGTATIGVELSFSMVVGEKFAADWIYAANLGADGRAFLAGYSGTVVVVSSAGVPERVYDIGAVPRHIVDAGDRLYILTDTRLYVVAGERLEALVDVYGASDVVVADLGFALLEPKAITWYAPDGTRLGAVRTKDPLRRAFSTGPELVVETRQHRAVITGAPPWWT